MFEISLFAHGKTFIDVTNGYVMNLDEDKIFLCVWLLYSVNFFADSRMEVRRYRRMDINRFNMVVEKFSFDLKFKHIWTRR